MLSLDNPVATISWALLHWQRCRAVMSQTSCGRRRGSRRPHMQFKSCGGVNPIGIALVPAAVPESESFGIILPTTLSEESWFAPSPFSYITPSTIQQCPWENAWQQQNGNFANLSSCSGRYIRECPQWPLEWYDRFQLFWWSMNKWNNSMIGQI